jgi:hypothetical protein
MAKNYAAIRNKLDAFIIWASMGHLACDARDAARAVVGDRRVKQRYSPSNSTHQISPKTSDRHAYFWNNSGACQHSIGVASLSQAVVAMFALLLIAGIGVFAAILAFWRPQTALRAMVFLLPWQGLDSDIGLRVTAAQLFLAPLAIRAIAEVMAGRATILQRYAIPLVPFVIYSVLISIAQFPFLPSAYVEGGALRSPEARALIQIAVFILTLTPALIVPVYCRAMEDIKTLLRVFTISCVALAALGWFQLFAWYALGVNPFPVGWMDTLLGTQGAALIREGQYALDGTVVYRMNSLGGEPKNLGGALVYAMILIQLARTNGLVRSNKSIFAWGFLGASMLATLSTTAIYLWVIGTVAMVLTGVRPGLARKFSVGALVTGLTVVVITGSLLTESLQSLFQSSSISISEVLFDRTLGREQGFLEDFDSGILAFLTDHPLRAIFGVGLGTVHLYAEPYLTPIVAAYAAGKVFAAKAGYLRVISEVGLVGLALLFLAVLRVAYYPRYAATDDAKAMSTFAQQLGVVTFICFCAAMSGPELYLAIGCIISYNAAASAKTRPLGTSALTPRVAM